MLSKKALKAEISSLESLGEVAATYAEIASVRMKRTRNSVLYSREYLAAVSEIFSEVLANYRSEVEKIASKAGAKKGQITFLAHTRRKVAVFLSSNAGLHGEIVSKTFEFFMREIRNADFEVTIVGKTGRAMFTAALPEADYTYFDLPDYHVSQDEIIKIVNHLVPYEEVHVYFGQFESMILQNPTKLNISALSIEAGKAPLVKYIFEPSLEKILIFFESEIFTSVFEQTVHESELSKFASRMISMDEAEQNIRKKLFELSMSQLRLEHTLQNNKQIAYTVPFMWKRQG